MGYNNAHASLTYNGSTKEVWEHISAVAYRHFDTKEQLRSALNAVMVAASGAGSAFAFGSDQASEDVFRDFQAGFEARIRAALDEDTAGDVIPFSRERIAILSQTFNLGFVGTHLAAALLSVGRAAAWFEIRFRSN